MAGQLCACLEVHPSGFYAWQRAPRSARSREDERLCGPIKQFWLESGAAYGYRNIHSDLRETGESCGPNRVHRLMRGAGIRVQVGYRRPRHKAGSVHNITPNHSHDKTVTESFFQ
ncbi:Mobile element protein [Acidihalobacter prosperus]|uniref:Mobile element protein n=1 Tax=Acidihalobacter prosperus TaxID=160660 RepID=A0A1A6C7V0_9GAMM|nr:Mobile element protein [Acidihalobacter prosperus]